MIAIYSTPTCPWCKKAKAHFDALKVTYTDYDVSQDETKAREMIEKSGQMGVPVIDIEGDVVVGFDRPRIDEALRKHKLVP